MRLVTRQQNLANRGRLRTNKTSKFKGVRLRKGNLQRPWSASIAKTTEGVKKVYHVGYFYSERDAAIAYDRKARALFGEYAMFNLPDEFKATE